MLLASELPNLVFNHEVPYKAWNHIDFACGIDAKAFVYNPLIEQMEKVRDSFAV